MNTPAKLQWLPYGPGHVAQLPCMCARGPKQGILFVGSFPLTVCAACATEAEKKRASEFIFAREVRVLADQEVIA